MWATPNCHCPGSRFLPQNKGTAEWIQVHLTLKWHCHGQWKQWVTLPSPHCFPSSYLESSACTPVLLPATSLSVLVLHTWGQVHPCLHTSPQLTSAWAVKGTLLLDGMSLAAVLFRSLGPLRRTRMCPFWKAKVPSLFTALHFWIGLS